MFAMTMEHVQQRASEKEQEAPEHPAAVIASE